MQEATNWDGLSLLMRGYERSNAERHYAGGGQGPERYGDLFRHGAPTSRAVPRFLARYFMK